MIDTNKDGKVSKDEWATFRNRVFTGLDKDKSGFLETGEFYDTPSDSVAFATAAFSRCLRTKEMFDKVAANGDGKVSRDEFTCPLRTRNRRRDVGPQPRQRPLRRRGGHAKLSGSRCALTALVLCFRSFAIQAEGIPPTVPEVKKTVDALVGHWRMAGNDWEAGAKSPAPVNATMDCKPAALGAAVRCIIAAQVADAKIEAATVIGYSPDEQVVRWMEISSTGEYHDHRGTWEHDMIAFEPLSYTAGGVKTTEFFTVAFPSPGRLVLKSTSRTAEGESFLELTGNRGDASPGRPGS